MGNTSNQGDRLLRLNDFLGRGKRIPISRSAWWKGVAERRYPDPVKLGPKITAWREADIDALVARGID